MNDKQDLYHRVNDLDDLEPVNPIHVLDHPGFFYFEKNEDLAVNKSAEVLNLRTGKILKPRPNLFNKCYVFISNPAEKVKAYQVHRIVAITFVGKPSRHKNKTFEELEVNHVDGNRFNNLPNNLEWVTGKENTLHSHLSGFNPRDKPVIAKHVLSGKEKYYTSSKNCADEFGVNRKTFWKHLEKGLSGKYHKNLFVFKYDDNSTWNTNEIDDLKTLGKSNLSRMVIFENLIDKTKIIFQSIKEASKYTNISHVTLWRKVNKNDVTIIGNYKFTLR